MDILQQFGKLKNGIHDQLDLQENLENGLDALLKELAKRPLHLQSNTAELAGLLARVSKGEKRIDTALRTLEESGNAFESESLPALAGAIENRMDEMSRQAYGRMVITHFAELAVQGGNFLTELHDMQKAVLAYVASDDVQKRLSQVDTIGLVEEAYGQSDAFARFNLLRKAGEDISEKVLFALNQGQILHRNGPLSADDLKNIRQRLAASLQLAAILPADPPKKRGRPKKIREPQAADESEEAPESSKPETDEHEKRRDESKVKEEPEADRIEKKPQAMLTADQARELLTGRKSGTAAGSSVFLTARTEQDREDERRKERCRSLLDLSRKQTEDRRIKPAKEKKRKPVCIENEQELIEKACLNLEDEPYAGMELFSSSQPDSPVSAAQLETDLGQSDSLCRSIFLLAAQREFITPEMAENFLQTNRPDELRQACTELYQKRYLSRAVCEVGSPMFFTLGAQGKKVLQDEECLQWLFGAGENDKAIPVRVDTDDSRNDPAVLAVGQAAARAIEAAFAGEAFRNVYDSKGNRTFVSMTEPGGFFYRLADRKSKAVSEKSVGFVFGVPQNRKDLDEMLAQAQELADKCTLIVCVTLTPESAQAAAQWLDPHFENTQIGWSAPQMSETVLVKDGSFVSDQQLVSFAGTIPVVSAPKPAEEKPSRQKKTGETSKKSEAKSRPAQKQKKPAEAKPAAKKEESRPEKKEETVSEEEALVQAARDEMLLPYPDKDVQQLLEDDMPYAAMALMHAAKKENTGLGMQLAYGIQDPAQTLPYDGLSVLGAFEAAGGGKDENSELFAAAALRCLFADFGQMDYGARDLWEKARQSQTVLAAPAFGRLLDLFYAFKTETHQGADLYASWHAGGRKSDSELLKEIRKDLAGFSHQYLENAPREKASNYRLLECRRWIFGADAPVSRLYELVKEEADSPRKLEAEFKRIFIKEGTPVSVDTIDPEKIAAIIDQGWEEAAKKLNNPQISDKLIGKARNSLNLALRNFAELLARYLQISTRMDKDSRKGRKAFEAKKQEFQDALAQAKKQLWTGARASVLRYTLDELSARLDGSWRGNRLLYTPFLLSDDVCLDENLLPVFYPVPGQSESEALQAVMHYRKARAAGLPDYAKRADRILSGVSDAYGDLARILELPQDYTSLGAGQIASMKKEWHEGMAAAAGQAAIRHQEFAQDLALALLQGKIASQDEELAQTLKKAEQQCYEETAAAGDFSAYYQVLESLQAFLDTQSESRLDELTGNIRQLYVQAQDPMQTECLNQAGLYINESIPAAAQFQIERFTRDDCTWQSPQMPSTFEDFMQVFETLYGKVSRKARTSVLNTLSLRRKSGEALDHARELIRRWPIDGTSNAFGVQMLLELLGFKGFAVKEAENKADGIACYPVSCKENCLEQSAAFCPPFGSEARKKGFQVLIADRPANGQQIVEACMKYPDANTLVVTNTALSLPERRALARSLKKSALAISVAVVDLVAAAWLIESSAPEHIRSEMLQITMPFGLCQPFAAGSVKNGGQKSRENLPLDELSSLGFGSSLTKALEQAPAGSLIWGLPGSGRTTALALLCKKAEESGKTCLWIDASGKNSFETLEALIALLKEKGLMPADVQLYSWSALAQWMADTAGLPSMVFIADDADVWMKQSREKKYASLTALAALARQSGGRFSYALSTLHRPAFDAPLPDDFVTLAAGPFTQREGRMLLEAPLHTLGIAFDNSTHSRALEDSLLHLTRLHPKSVAAVSSALTEGVQKAGADMSLSAAAPWVLNEQTLKIILENTALYERVQNTLSEALGEDRIWQSVLLMLASCLQTDSKESAGAEEIKALDDALEILGLSLDEVKNALDELCAMNILVCSRDGQYAFASSSCAALFGPPAATEARLTALLPDKTEKREGAANA